MKKQGVKERIIATASDLFYFNGYNQTGINQIIAEANVAKASMYQHFRSKEDIAVAYLEARHAKWMENLAVFVADKSTSKEKILGSFDYLDKWLREVNFRGCGFQNIITDIPKDQTKINTQVLLHKNEVGKWIKNILEEDNQYSGEKSKVLAEQILVVIEGAIILSQIQKSAHPVAVAKGVCMMLLG